MRSLPPEFVAAVVGAAATWEGTPLRWQQTAKGPNGGADCKGFIWGVARELELPEAASSYALMANYGRKVDVRLLREGLEALFDRIDGAPEAADVILLRVRGAPNHLGLMMSADEVMLAQLAPVGKVARASLDHLERRYGVHLVLRWRQSAVDAWMEGARNAA